MTAVKYRTKPVWHETRAAYDGRPLLVAETPSNLLLRRKGTRQVLELPWTIVYLRAAVHAARIVALDKANAKRGKRREQVGASANTVKRGFR